MTGDIIFKLTENEYSLDRSLFYSINVDPTILVFFFSEMSTITYNTYVQVHRTPYRKIARSVIGKR